MKLRQLLAALALGLLPVSVSATDSEASEVEARDLPHGPVFVDFNGGNQVAVELVRVGMLRQVLSFSLDVDETGKPTDCAINRKFRRKYIQIAICRPLMKYHTFEPARNEKGEPVPGKYNGIINYNSFLSSDGSRNDRGE